MRSDNMYIRACICLQTDVFTVCLQAGVHTGMYVSSDRGTCGCIVPSDRDQNPSTDEQQAALLLGIQCVIYSCTGLPVDDILLNTIFTAEHN